MEGGYHAADDDDDQTLPHAFSLSSLALVAAHQGGPQRSRHAHTHRGLQSHKESPQNGVYAVAKLGLGGWRMVPLFLIWQVRAVGAAGGQGAGCQGPHCRLFVQVCVHDKGVRVLGLV